MRFVLILAVWTILAIVEFWHVVSSDQPQFITLLVAWAGGVFSTLLYQEACIYLLMRRHRLDPRT